MDYKACFIGAGNLATHLSQELQKIGIDIVQVYSRTESSALKLANRLNASFTTRPEDIKEGMDLYFVAIKDSSVSEVLSRIQFGNKLLVHCSGSLPMSVLAPYSENIGVFYPLQTFSKDRKVSFGNIPVFIEANTMHNEDVLGSMAKGISTKVSVLESERRKCLHVAAVFACNFVNHLYTIAANFLGSKDIPFEVLRPLILETAEKVQEMQPVAAQTGPAVRFDKNIINSHLEELEGLNNYGDLYDRISRSIFEHHKELK